jgi:dihydroorotate dehydrogenase electron transfer subunit
MDSDIFPLEKAPSMLKDSRALIVRRESRGAYCRLVLKSPLIARDARPGQFLMVQTSNQPYPLLRRPFSIHARTGETVEIFFSRVGWGTEILAQKKTGETLDILGPLGKGFVLGGGAGDQAQGPPQNKGDSAESLKGKMVFLVGGGRGIAPLYFLAGELRKQEAVPIIFYGGKTKSDIPLVDRFKARKFGLLVSTDDGSTGFPGLVSAMLERELARLAELPLPVLPLDQADEPKTSTTSQVAGPPQAGFPACIYACGPEAMMSKIAELAAAYSIPAQFSLEAVMGCGIGACWSCVRKIRRGDKVEWVKICQEGPVFHSSEIVWENE